MSNIGRNHWITNQWGKLLTSARYPTYNVNGNQGTRYIQTVMNRFVEVEWTVEFFCQETLMYFLGKWQGYLPLRHVGSKVSKNVSSFKPRKWFGVDGLKLCWKESLDESSIIQLSTEHDLWRKWSRHQRTLFWSLASQ